MKVEKQYEVEGKYEIECLYKINVVVIGIESEFLLRKRKRSAKSK